MMIDYSFGNYSKLAAILGGVGIFFLLFFVIFMIAIIVVEVIALWKFFQKCGKNGWESIIPIYNSWIEVEIAGLNWWWFLFLIFSVFVYVSDIDNYKVLVGIVPLFGNLVCNYNLSKKFHQDTGFAILMTLFPWLMFPIIAFSKKYQYDNSVIVSKNGIFKDDNHVDTSFSNNTNTNSSTHVNSNSSYCINCGTKLSSDDKFCPNCGKEK